MSVAVEKGRIVLAGDGRIEDAEALLQFLLAADGPNVVDVSGCRSLHTALVQLLAAFKPEITGVPENAFLSQSVLPALARAPATNAGGQGPSGGL